MQTTQEQKHKLMTVRVNENLWNEFQKIANQDYQAPASQIIRQLMLDLVNKSKKAKKAVV